MKNKINYVGIISALVMAIAVFLPWIEGSGGYGSESMTGFEFDDVKFSPLISLVGAFVAFKRIRWAVMLIGIINLLHGLLHYGYYMLADKLSSDSTSGMLSVTPVFGLYLFLIAAVVFMFSVKKKAAVPNQKESSL